MSMFDMLGEEAGLVKASTAELTASVELEEVQEAISVEEFEMLQHEDKMDYLETTIVGLENIHEHVAGRQCAGMSEAEAKLMHDGMANLLSPLGMEFSVVGGAVEDFGDEAGAVMATTASVEGIKDKIKQIAEAIRKFITKAIEKAKQMFRAMSLRFGKLEKNGKALANAKVEGTAEKVKGVSDKFCIGSKVATAKDIIALTAMLKKAASDKSIEKSVDALAAKLKEMAGKEKLEAADYTEINTVAYDVFEALTAPYGVKKAATKDQIKKAGFGDSYNEVQVSDTLVGGFTFVVGMSSDEKKFNSPKFKVIREESKVKSEDEFDAVGQAEINAIGGAIQDLAKTAKELSESYSTKTEDTLISAVKELGDKSEEGVVSDMIASIRGYSALLRNHKAGACSMAMGVGHAAYNFGVKSIKAHKKSK